MIEAAIQETLNWLDRPKLWPTKDIEGKRKELEGVVNPIMMKAYEAVGGGERLEAKTGLKSYCFTARTILQDPKLKDKFKAGQKEGIEAFIQRTLDLLEIPSSVFADKDDFEGMQKELEEALNPIMMKAYQAAGGGEMPSATIDVEEDHTRFVLSPTAC